MNWHNQTGTGTQRTLICSFAGQIANAADYEKIAGQVWPGEELLYSMFDERIGEYEVEDVRRFIRLIADAGFAAAYLVDYDPADFGSGSSISLCVFDPSQSVTIKGRLA